MSEQQYGTFTAYNPNAKSTALAGDEDPEDFDWTVQLSDMEIQTLLERNEVVQIASEWAVLESTREGIEFLTDESIAGQKHGEPYPFETRNEYLQWINFFEENDLCEIWSETYGISYMLFYGNEKDLSKPSKPYTHCKAFTKLIGTNGISVEETDDFGVPTKYKLQLMTEGMKQAKTILIDADRIVEYKSRPRRIQYGGSSKVRHIAKVALAEEQMLKALIKRAKDNAGGFLKGNARQLGDALVMDQEVGNPTYLKKIYLGEGMDLKYETPDLKSTQYKDFFEILSTKFCRALRVSKSSFQGDALGTQSTAKFNFLFTYTTIFQLQKHYHNTLEMCFFKLGMKDTRFSWNDPFPEENAQNAQDETNADGDNGNGTTDGDGIDQSTTSGESPSGESDPTDSSTPDPATSTKPAK